MNKVTDTTARFGDLEVGTAFVYNKQLLKKINATQAVTLVQHHEEYFIFRKKDIVHIQTK